MSRTKDPLLTSVYEFIVYEFSLENVSRQHPNKMFFFLLALKVDNFLFPNQFYIYSGTKDAIDFKPFSRNEWKGSANSK